jgi:hypothetical protein
MRSAFFWDITQRTVVIPYQRFGTTYRFPLQGSRSPRIPLKIWPTICPETSVWTYHYTLHNTAEERRSDPACMSVISNHLPEGSQMQSISNILKKSCWSRRNNKHTQNCCRITPWTAADRRVWNSNIKIDLN